MNSYLYEVRDRSVGVMLKLLRKYPAPPGSQRPLSKVLI
jgi:hypothetical protein